MTDKNSSPARNVEAPRGFSVAQAAAYLGICRARVYALVRSGELEARKLGARTIILRDELDRFLDNLPPFRGGA